MVVTWWILVVLRSELFRDKIFRSIMPFTHINRLRMLRSGDWIVQIFLRQKVWSP